MCVCDMMDDIMEDKSEIHNNASDFLPDFTEGNTFEQICFDKKVNKANEKFVSIRKDIIRWIPSPHDNRSYPKSVKSNKHAFKQNAKKYSYDSIMKKLLLHRVCHDGIGKLSN